MSVSGKSQHRGSQIMIVQLAILLAAAASYAQRCGLEDICTEDKSSTVDPFSSTEVRADCSSQGSVWYIRRYANGNNSVDGAGTIITLNDSFVHRGTHLSIRNVSGFSEGSYHCGLDSNNLQPASLCLFVRGRLVFTSCPNRCFTIINITGKVNSNVSLDTSVKFIGGGFCNKTNQEIRWLEVKKDQVRVYFCSNLQSRREQLCNNTERFVVDLQQSCIPPNIRLCKYDMRLVLLNFNVSDVGIYEVIVEFTINLNEINRLMQQFNITLPDQFDGTEASTFDPATSLPETDITAVDMFTFDTDRVTTTATAVDTIGSLAITTTAVTVNEAGSLTVIIGVSVSVSIGSIILLGIIVASIVLIIKRKRENALPHCNIELLPTRPRMNDTGPEFVSSTNRYVQSTKLGCESFIRNFHESDLLIPGRHIQLGHTVGQGEFGLVYRSYLTGWQGRTTAEVVAVKTLKCFYSTKNVEDLIAESKKMKQFNHPNVMGLIGICIDVGERPYIVMPFMANGSLLTYLKKERARFTLAEDAESATIEDGQRKLLSMCLQIAKGMRYLAGKKFIHRDLAARNCMIDDQFLIKVGDFGLSEEIYATNYFRQVEGAPIRLPVKWMALESLLDGVFSEKTDVWSYGVTCWEVFSLGHTPYPAIDPFDLVRLLQSGRRLDKPANASCTNQVYTLIAQCWSEAPEERPLFKDLVHEIDSLLVGVAGYIEFSKFSSDI